MRTALNGAIGAVLLALWLIACSGAPAPAPRDSDDAAAVEPAPELAPRTLVDHVSAAGLRWMVVGRPRELAETPGTLRLLSPLFPETRLDAFAEGTGVDLRRTDSALVAGFDYGTLYMASTGQRSNLPIEEKFALRLVKGAVVTSPHPRIRRIRGVAAGVPRALVSIEHRLVAVAIGDPTPARVVDAFARGKLKKSPSALEGAALSSLPSELHAAPVRFYAPGPFEREWLGGVRGLLATTRAVGIAARPMTGERLHVTIVLSGDYDELGPAHLLDAWQDLATSNLGRLAGLDSPAAAPILSTVGDSLKLRVELHVRPLVDGIHHAVAAEVTEILRMEPQSPQSGGTRPEAGDKD